MTTSQSWLDVVAQRLGPPIMTTGDEVRFNCWRPDCGSGPDTHYHVYVNPRKGRFFCQRCQRGGTIDFLSRMLNLPEPEDSLSMWDSLVHEFLWGTRHTEDDYEYLAWPREYQRIVPGMEAYRYLRARGVSDRRIDHFQLGFGIRELKNRIIFPDVDVKGRLVYWVARKYGKLDYTKAPKYKNADVPRRTQVYNLGRILANGWSRKVIICEGPISANIAGLAAVATYGKYVTGDQVSRLVSAKFDEYIVAFDGDALLEGVSLATRLFRRGCKVRFIKFNRTDDPADVGSVAVRRMACTAPQWNSFSALEVLA